MAIRGADAFRAAFDLKYAASLSEANWAEVMQSPEWHVMVAENADLLTPVMAAFPERFSVAAQQTLPPRPIPDGPFQIIGKPAPRLHGFGHVTGTGQYSEHMTRTGMLFMRSPKSPVSCMVGHAFAKPSYVTRPSNCTSEEKSSSRL